MSSIWMNLNHVFKVFQSLFFAFLLWRKDGLGRRLPLALINRQPLSRILFVFTKVLLVFTRVLLMFTRVLFVFTRVLLVFTRVLTCVLLYYRSISCMKTKLILYWFCNVKKQPPKVFYRKGILKNFAKRHRKTPVSEFLFQ